MRGILLPKAQEILGCPVQVISGEEEARLDSPGRRPRTTPGGADERLVVDIGGASTELVTGTGAQTTSLFSLSMAASPGWNAILPTVIWAGKF